MARTKNSIKNIILALCLKAVNVIGNFVIRTIMIRRLGMQATSLNGLFTEVLAALSMAEMGVGTAIVYNLYKPLAEHDHKKVRQLMGLFKTAYRIIALATFLIGLAICPWIHYMVNSIDYSLNYIRLVYMLFVVDLSMSYLFSYKVSLMNADQKNHIQSKISMVLKPIEVIIKVMVVLVTNNFLAYLLFSVLITVLGNIVRSYVVDQYYPWLGKNEDMLPKEERKQVFANIKNLFIKTLSGKITSSTDNMLISILVDTLQVGYYSNYSLPMGVFRQLANQVAYGGVSASLGNLLVTESEEKCAKVFYRLEYLFFVIASLASVCIYCCITPFILVWLKTDDFLLGKSVVFICCLNLFMEIVNRPLWSIMEVSGLFKYDKYVSLAGSVVNLFVSIVLGMKWGMSGIFVGTFMTYLIQSVLKTVLLFRMRFHQSPLKQYGLLACMSGGMLLQMFIADTLCNKFVFENPMAAFIVYGFISVGIVGSSTVLCTFCTDSFRYYFKMVTNTVKHIFRTRR